MQQIQRYFRKAGKALARFFGRVKKGSPIDIAILVCAAALIIALLAILVMSLLPDAAPVDASSSAPSSSSVSAAQSGSYDPDSDALDKQAYDGTILPETADGGQTYIDETMFLGDSNTYRLVAYGLTTWQNNLSAVGMGHPACHQHAVHVLQGFIQPGVCRQGRLHDAAPAHRHHIRHQ